jgi:Family of unknown function (DUF5330)
MRFLFRLTFWLAVVMLLLPRAGSQSPSNVGVGEAVSAAKATVSDMRGFCERQPIACAVGAQTAVELGHRAQAGAKFLYDYLNEHLEPDVAGRTLPRPENRGTPAGQDTLSPADRLPVWRGLHPRREARLDRRTQD